MQNIRYSAEYSVSADSENLGFGRSLPRGHIFGFNWFQSDLTDLYNRLAEEAKWCLDNGDSCWKCGLDEETIRAVSKFNLTDLVMRRFGNP